MMFTLRLRSERCFTDRNPGAFSGNGFVPVDPGDYDIMRIKFVDFQGASPEALELFDVSAEPSFKLVAETRN
jgi:hypothetical protein